MRVPLSEMWPDNLPVTKGWRTSFLAAFEEVFLFALLSYRRLQCPAAAAFAPVLNVSLYDYGADRGSHVSVLYPQHL